MSVTWKYVKPLTHVDEVRTFTQRHKVRLPEKLIVFLGKYNSGRPSKPTFDTVERDGHVFNSLYSYNVGDANYIADTYDSVFAGTGLYPVAIEASGNVVCFELKSKTLVMWCHENDRVVLIDTSSNSDLFSEIV